MIAQEVYVKYIVKVIYMFVLNLETENARKRHKKGRGDLH